MLTPTPESRLGHLLDGHLELVGILGVGAYGVVYTALDIHTNTPFAVKALSKLDLDPRQRKFQAREIALHARAQAHPNIVSLIEILDAPDCVYVVMEFCPEGDLFAVITDHGGYVGDDELARSVFLQLLDAVEHCHNLGIYHRDLKPENVLVCDNGQTVKLADFGLATTDEVTADFGCGSTFYMSPECQSMAPRSFNCYASAANDIWSLGVMLVNLTCGRNPWKRASVTMDDTFRAFVKQPDFLSTILPLSEELNYILKRIFQLDPARRISLAELRHLILHCPVFTILQEEDSLMEHAVMETAIPAVAVYEAPDRPSTPLRPQQAFCQMPATPCTPSSGRSHHGKADPRRRHEAPPTPITPSNAHRHHRRISQHRTPRQQMTPPPLPSAQLFSPPQVMQATPPAGFDSCSSIASSDSLSSLPYHDSHVASKLAPIQHTVRPHQGKPMSVWDDEPLPVLMAEEEEVGFGQALSPARLQNMRKRLPLPQGLQQAPPPLMTLQPAPANLHAPLFGYMQ